MSQIRSRLRLDLFATSYPVVSLLDQPGDLYTAFFKTRHGLFTAKYTTFFVENTILRLLSIFKNALNLFGRFVLDVHRIQIGNFLFAKLAFSGIIWRLYIDNSEKFVVIFS